MEDENETTDLTSLQAAHQYVAFVGVVATTAVALYALGKLSVDLTKATIEHRKTVKAAKKNKDD